MTNLFKVDGQTLTPIEIYPAVSDTVNYLTFAFMFSFDWAGLTKSAIFTKGTDIYEVVLTNDEVLESDHVNLTAGTWSISVVGDTVVDAVVTRQITTSSYEYTVTQSSATSGGVFPPSIASQVYANVNQATPQTFVGGIPKLAADREISDDNDLVDKKHVADVVATVTADDFNHNDLANKQGGTSNEYYHVTAAEKTVIQNTSGTNTGDQDVFGAISTHNTDAGAHGLSDKFVQIFDNVLVFSASTFSQHTAYIDPTMVFNSDGFVYTRGQAANYVIKFAFPTEIGETYHIDFSLAGTITEAVVSNSLYGYSGGAVKATLVLAAGVYSCQFVADTATSYLYFSIPFSSATITVFDALGYKETETGNVYLNTDFIKDAGIPLSKLEPQDACNYQGGELQMFKKILCIGDSLTSGVFDHYVGATLEYFTDANYAYPTYLKALTGRDTGNLGVGGATFAQWYTTHELTDVSGYDCAIIALGLNDAVYATTSGDRLAAMASIVTKIKTANTGIKIFMANILPYYNNANVTAVNADIASFADATSDVYLMDIHTNGSVADNAAYRAGHLTAIGYQRLAKDYFCYASYLISTNMSDFRFVQYIGTAYEYTA